MASDDLLGFHAFCLTDTGTRLDQFRQALARTVQPGDVVADLGTGSGLLSFLACRAGARRVYAVEESDAIAYGRLLATAAGLRDRIEFIQTPSAQVSLPERADVIVGDVFESFGLQPRGLSSFLDARDRWLRPGGTLIPHHLQLYVAPVDAPATYARALGPWTGEVQGIDLAPIRALAVNHQHAGRFSPSELLATPAPLTAIDLVGASSLHVGGSVTVVAERSGLLHGVCGCFVATLAEGITVGNVPGDSGTSNFAQAFFPIASPVTIASGDAIALTVHLYDGTEMRWAVEVTRADHSQVRFDHATFHGQPLTLDALRKQSDGYQPSLTPRGRVERALLDRFDGTRNTAELEAWLAETFRDVLPSVQEVRAVVRSAIERCG